MKQQKRIILFSLLTFLIALGSLELGARIYLFSIHKIWISSKILFQSKFFQGDLRESTESCTWGDTITLHPFLEIIYSRANSCQKEYINAYGIKGRDIPEEKDKNYYTILVLGGSVAENIASGSNKLLPQLEILLNEILYSPSRKPFRILNGAIAGSKQPIQLISFLLFSDKIDAVISIEGFNESYLYGSNDPLESPPNYWEEMVKIQKKDFYGILFQDLSHRFYYFLQNQFPFYHSSFLYVLAEQFLNIFYLPELKRKHYFPPIKYGLGLKERKNNFLFRYRKYLSHLHLLTKANNLPLAIFLQPVPALFKELTKMERNVVGNLAYASNYLELTEQLLLFKEKGIPIHSLLHVFEKYKETIYKDHIHYQTSRDGIDGRAIVDKEIIRILEKEWKLKKK